MVIKFILPKSTKNIKVTPSRNKRNRRGYGNTIIKEIFGNSNDSEKLQSLLVRSVEVEVNRMPSLKEGEIRTRNESEWQRLNEHGQILEDVKPIFDRSEFLRREHLRMFNDLHKAIKTFDELYKRSYKEDPPKPFSKYEESELARIYTYVVYEKNAPEPDQTYLFHNTKISQSTWSRAFRKRIFWEYVEECFKPIWKATPIVAGRLDSLKQKVREKKEIPTEDFIFKKSSHFKPGLKRGKVDNTDEFSVDLQIDAERFKSMDRNRLIKAIQSLCPEANPNGLKDSTDDELRIVLAELSK